MIEAVEKWTSDKRGLQREVSVVPTGRILSDKGVLI